MRLRAHHLLCMLTYSGKGYSEAFVQSFNHLVQRVGAGEVIELLAGPDDVCAPIAGDAEEHCHCASVTRRDRLASSDLAPLVGVALAPGARLTLTAPLLATLRAAFAAGGIRRACEGCPWHAMCTEVAAQGYGGTLLRASGEGRVP
ncbi:MAG: DUF1284 domain-containing protein [Comamonadaceae bacterium]|nr:DUF1284 domain-containing protein [Comamonadaceae bacterium]